MANYKLNLLGVMIDMSRNSVMTPQALKRFLPILKKMGYNCVMLYTEDTYEVDKEPFFGYMRGRYTKEELKDLDDFAYGIGIELIPCIQTLAHLNATIRWGTFPIDVEDISLVGNDRVYELIEHLLSSVSECFRTRKIHIGMDEAWLLGRGKYHDINGCESKCDIMKKHLEKVNGLLKKYNFEPMMWSDMFFYELPGGGYYHPETKIPKDVKDSVPENMSLVYWDYYHGEEKQYDDMISNHKRMTDKVWFAGGAWSWAGFAPLNGHTLATMLPAMRSCRRNKIRNIFFTMWGDNGGECSHFAQLPVLLYLAEAAKGNEDEEKIKAKFKRIVGADYDDFMALELPNKVKDSGLTANPCKYMLFADTFNDWLDYTVSEGAAVCYPEYAKKLREAAKHTRKYSYLFDCAAKLCDVLEYKYELGYKTRKAYEAKDKKELLKLAENDYKEVEKRLRIFLDAFRKQWFTEYKPSGFDVQEYRLGAVIQRMHSCGKRLSDYAKGKTDSIPELEEKLLIPKGATEGKPIFSNNFCTIASTNVM